MGKKRKEKDQSVTVYRTVMVLVIVFFVGAFAISKLSGRGAEVELSQADGRVVALAECLTEKGVKMYGAYWCSHCQSQKKEFGSAFEKVDYVECSVPGNPRVQAEGCIAAGVESYPTWIFADGSKEVGEQSFEDLAAKSGCEWEE